MSQTAVEQIVNRHIQGCFLGLSGEPVVKGRDVNLVLGHVMRSSCK
jgi:hypothetical protein